MLLSCQKSIKNRVYYKRKSHLTSFNVKSRYSSPSEFYQVFARSLLTFAEYWEVNRAKATCISFLVNRDLPFTNAD